MRAALELVADGGYGALTTAAVAVRAGASTASLYRRWPTKHALIADIARTLTRDAWQDTDTGTLSGELHAFITRKRQLFDRVGSVVLALLAEAGHDAELHEILHREVLDETAARVRAILTRAATRGEAVEPSDELVRVLSLAVVGGELLRQTLTSAEQRMPSVAAEVTMIEQAVAPA